jgi:hypothetical protein
MVRLSMICRYKSKSGLGVKDLRNMNISLLCKWRCRLEMRDGLWSKIVKAKYLREDTVT